MKTFTRFIPLSLLPLLVLWPVVSRGQAWQSATALPSSATGPCHVSCVAPDGAGGYVVGGNFIGTVTFGNTVLTSAGGLDGFVARLTSAGTWAQAVSVGGPEHEYVSAVVVAPNGVVTVVGEFASPSLLLGAITLVNATLPTPATPDVFVARLAANGQWTQAARAGGPGLDSARGLAIDATGAAVVVGRFAGSASFGNIAVQSSGSTNFGLFVAKWSSSGTWTRVTTAQGDAASEGYGVALQANGDLVVCGSFSSTSSSGGTIEFGNTTFTTAGFETHAFVARLNSAGTWTQAAQSDNTRGFVTANCVAADGRGNAVVAGSFAGTDVSFGPRTLTYGGNNAFHLFVARLNSAGAWTQAVQAVGDENQALGLALDNAGTAWLTGYFSGQAVAFGNYTLVNTSANFPQQTPDIFLASLDNGGTWTGAAQAGGSGNDLGRAVCLDARGPVVAGDFAPPSASFGGSTLSVSYNSGFIARASGVLRAASPTATPLPLRLSPNPATNQTVVALPAATAPRQLQVLDACGREVRRQQVPAQETRAVLDLAGVAPGFYLVRCGAQTGRLVVE